ncbi:hypothetical protein IWX90DRAFT_483302 [Phyllosticta citrichinensis]|uniref:Swiss Army Knife RNA repair protein HAD domain-containing protein n=1 Tax=Phyllosticta citrichinensis TaxID=1130410 RepID=A0ABR1Y213_9PEZI
MALPAANNSAAAHLAGTMRTYTKTNLRRWSCLDKELPDVNQIKAIHLYDWDNTLFATPLPSDRIWTPSTIGLLQSQDAFVYEGGWWHNPKILAATGEGIEKEEPRAWDGCWDEDVVELVRMSMEQKDVLTVMVTGRQEDRFADLIQRMAKSKKLDFDLMCLKPAVGPQNQQFHSTMMFKQEFIKDLVYTYNEATEMRIYEDRPKHAAEFRRLFASLNEDWERGVSPAPRKPLVAEVIDVPAKAKFLDPLTEVEAVQLLVNANNKGLRTDPKPSAQHFNIEKNVLNTVYKIDEENQKRLIGTLIPEISGTADGAVRVHADEIFICRGVCQNRQMQRLGGIGKVQHWRITATGSLEDKIWAARVEPVPSNSTGVSSRRQLVLAMRKGAWFTDANDIQNWAPVPQDKAIEFPTTISEIIRLSLMRGHSPGLANDADKTSNSGRPPYQSSNFRGQSNPSQGGNNNGRRPPPPAANYRGGNQSRGRGGAYQRGGRDGGGRGGRQGRGGMNSRGGRSRPGQYRSLDDVGTSQNTGAGFQYEDGGYPY